MKRNRIKNVLKVVVLCSCPVCKQYHAQRGRYFWRFHLMLFFAVHCTPVTYEANFFARGCRKCVIKLAINAQNNHNNRRFATTHVQCTPIAWLYCRNAPVCSIYASATLLHSIEPSELKLSLLIKKSLIPIFSEICALASAL